MKPSKITITKVGNKTVLAPKEPLTHQSCNTLEECFTQCSAENQVQIILDCKSVAVFDSAGLELLVRINEELRSRGGQLVLVGLNDICHDILRTTRLVNELQIFKNIQESISG